MVITELPTASSVNKRETSSPPTGERAAYRERKDLSAAKKHLVEVLRPPQEKTQKILVQTKEVIAKESNAYRSAELKRTLEVAAGILFWQTFMYDLGNSLPVGLMFTANPDVPYGQNWFDIIDFDHTVITPKDYEYAMNVFKNSGVFDQMAALQWEHRKANREAILQGMEELIHCSTIGDYYGAFMIADQEELEKKQPLPPGTVQYQRAKNRLEAAFVDRFGSFSGMYSDERYKRHVLIPLRKMQIPATDDKGKDEEKKGRFRQYLGYSLEKSRSYISGYYHRNFSFRKPIVKDGEFRFPHYDQGRLMFERANSDEQDILEHEAMWDVEWSGPYQGLFSSYINFFNEGVIYELAPCLSDKSNKDSFKILVDQSIHKLAQRMTDDLVQEPLLFLTNLTYGDWLAQEDVRKSLLRVIWLTEARRFNPVGKKDFRLSKVFYPATITLGEDSGINTPDNLFYHIPASDRAKIASFCKLVGMNSLAEYVRSTKNLTTSQLINYACKFFAYDFKGKGPEITFDHPRELARLTDSTGRLHGEYGIFNYFLGSIRRIGSLPDSPRQSSRVLSSEGDFLRAIQSGALEVEHHIKGALHLSDAQEWERDSRTVMKVFFAEKEVFADVEQRLIKQRLRDETVPQVTDAAGEKMAIDEADLAIDVTDEHILGNRNRKLDNEYDLHVLGMKLIYRDDAKNRFYFKLDKEHNLYARCEKVIPRNKLKNEAEICDAMGMHQLAADIRAAVKAGREITVADLLDMDRKYVIYWLPETGARSFFVENRQGLKQQGLIKDGMLGGACDTFEFFVSEQMSGIFGKDCVSTVGGFSLQNGVNIDILLHAQTRLRIEEEGLDCLLDVDPVKQQISYYKYNRSVVEEEPKHSGEVVKDHFKESKPDKTENKVKKHATLEVIAGLAAAPAALPALLRSLRKQESKIDEVSLPSPDEGIGNLKMEFNIGGQRVTLEGEAARLAFESQRASEAKSEYIETGRESLCNLYVRFLLTYLRKPMDNLSPVKIDALVHDAAVKQWHGGTNVWGYIPHLLIYSMVREELESRESVKTGGQRKKITISAEVLEHAKALLQVYKNNPDEPSLFYNEHRLPAYDPRFLDLMEKVLDVFSEGQEASSINNIGNTAVA